MCSFPWPKNSDCRLYLAFSLGILDTNCKIKKKKSAQINWKHQAVNSGYYTSEWLDIAIYQCFQRLNPFRTPWNMPLRTYQWRVYLIGKVGKIIFHKIKTAVNPLKLQNSVFDPTATGEQPVWLLEVEPGPQPRCARSNSSEYASSCLR